MTIASIIQTIQNLTTILVSVYPFFWKWWWLDSVFFCGVTNLIYWVLKHARRGSFRKLRSRRSRWIRLWPCFFFLCIFTPHRRITYVLFKIMGSFSSREQIRGHIGKLRKMSWRNPYLGKNRGGLKKEGEWHWAFEVACYRAER